MEEEHIRTIIKQNEQLHQVIGDMARTLKVICDVVCENLSPAQSVGHDLPDEGYQGSPATNRPKLLSSKEEEELLTYLLSDPNEQPVDPRMVLPRHVSIAFVTAYLETSTATFYREINDQLLEKAFTIGKRPYFRMSDLISLAKEKALLAHEKGAWTYAKMNKKKTSGK
ncbi:hypothetical protein G5B30_15995 [Sphingobacterium sp. SGG-5]|uniref:hypothetical protein n=1 Tax=Sphingobacterium sp. SGG-5 TaxID=2710881 RepID=UPI0013ED2B1E|nr:hypothetical protein [Sphingobacterium sp. SGG-5]NGM63413.1 hypothetical protein [Sphingobacterium sp. SGG-5]